jgi:hypothetical protein
MSSVTPIKKYLKEKITNQITEKFMEKLQNMVNQKDQDGHKKYKNINKKLEKTQK